MESFAVLLGMTRDDVEAGLGDIFRKAEDHHGFSHLSEFASPNEAIANSRFAAIPWTYTGVHVGEFEGISPKNEPVTITGVTIIDTEGKEPIYYRFVDWVSVMAQLGVVFSGRAVNGERLPMDDFEEIGASSA
jgi:hypothetical protein